MVKVQKQQLEASIKGGVLTELPKHEKIQIDKEAKYLS
jgi:hypothetical protein